MHSHIYTHTLYNLSDNYEAQLFTMSKQTIKKHVFSYNQFSIVSIVLHGFEFELYKAPSYRTIRGPRH